MLKKPKFRFIDWLVFFIVIPIPLLNIACLAWMVYHLGLWITLKRLLTLLGIYVVVLLGALMLSDVFVVVNQ